MKKISRSIRPVNSIIFVHGDGDIEIPVEKIGKGDDLWWSSSTCLAVAVYPEVDGATNLTIGPSRDVDPGYPAGFVGSILTPERRLIVEQVDQALLYDQIVPYGSTKIHLWFSHPVWPEKVFIGIDP